MADKFLEYDVGSTLGTVLTSPYNFQTRFSKVYAGNTGTLDDTLVLLAQEYDDTGAITGTQKIGTFPVPYGQTVVISDDDVESVPAGSHLLASSTYGSMVLTYARRYVYYRD